MPILPRKKLFVSIAAVAVSAALLIAVASWLHARGWLDDVKLGGSSVPLALSLWLLAFAFAGRTTPREKAALAVNAGGWTAVLAGQVASRLRVPAPWPAVEAWTFAAGMAMVALAAWMLHRERRRGAVPPPDGR